MRARIGVSLVLFSLALATSAAASTLRAPVDVRADDLRWESVDGQRVLRWDGAVTLEQTGEWELPALRLTFAVPVDRTLADLRLERGQRVRVGEADGLRRAPLAITGDGRPAGPERPFAGLDTAARRAAGTWPPVQARISGSAIVHGQKLVTVEVYPLSVDADGSVWLREDADLVAETVAAPVVLETAHRLRDPGGWYRSARDRLAGWVVNPQDLDAATPPPVVADGAAPSAKLGPTLESAPVRHLILTTSELATAYQRLADHRTRLGLPSLVVTLDDVLATTRQGADLAETIRNYVRDAYEKWGVDYLLIGGDTDLIPTRYVRSTFYPNGGFTDIPTDHYYGGLDGNWNADGDELFGEPFRSSVDPGDFMDFAPEVSVGRAPTNTPAEVDAFVDKILAYEMPASTDWQNRMLLASEVLFPLGWTEPEPVQYDGAAPSEELAAIVQNCSDPDWEITRLYERPDVYLGSEKVGVQRVVDDLNSGTYGVFHHIGHGFYFNMSVGDGALTPAEVDGLSNGPNYFFLYSLNCSSSAFDFNCLNERFVRNPDGGAVMSIGSSRSAFPSGSEPLQEAFYDTWMCGGQERVGDVVSATRIQFSGGSQVIGVTRWTQLIYTFLGDPGTALWPNTPRTVQAFGPPDVDLGGDSLTVGAIDPSTGGVEGARVTLSKDGEDYAIGTTGASGSVTLPFAAETTGNVEMWISGRGIPPTSLDLPVLDPGVGAPAMAGLVVDDDALGASVGNGNLRPEGGETVEVRPLVRNGSSADYQGSLATLSSSDPWVTVVDGSISLPAVAGGAQETATEAFVLAIDPAAPDHHVVELEILISPDGAGSLQVVDTENLALSAPALEVTAVEIDDLGNGNGTVETGEEIELRVRLENYGIGAAGQLAGTLALSAGAATVLDGTATWPDADGVLVEVENTADPLRVRVDGVVADVELELTVSDGAGRVTVHTFDLLAPPQVAGLRLVASGPGTLQIAWTSPVVADLLGYRVFREDEGGGPAVVASEDVILDIATFRESGLAALTTFTYRVAAVDSGGVQGALSDPFSASTNPPELECFPLPLGLETSGALAVGPTDGDGVADMVIGADFVYVIDGNCQEEFDGDGDAQTFGPVAGIEGRYGPSSIALGELGGSVGMEIVTIDRDTRRMWVLDGEGQALPGWPVTLLDWAWSTPAVSDLDGDGDLEIVVHDISGYTYAFHHDATEVADGDGDPGTLGVIAPRTSDAGVNEFFGRTSPALFDVDGDGRQEILFGSKLQNAAADEFFYALRTDGSGSNAPGWPKQFAPQQGFLASPAIGDIDADGIMEIVAPSENDSLYVWEPDGSRQPGFPIFLRNNALNADSLTPSPALGDFDGDGDLDMVVVSILRELVDGKNIWRSYVHVLDESGTNLPGWPQVVDDLSESSPVVGDLDGDGGLDVLYGIGGTEAEDFLFAWDTQGEPVRGFPIPINGFVRATPTITDFDGNGTTDIALATWDRLIHVWDTGAAYDPALVPWPTFRGNVNRTGVFGQAVRTDNGPRVPTPARAALGPAVPNPFNPRTLLRFVVPGQGGHVRLSVHDAQGRRVRTLVDARFAGGEHDVRWDGRDRAGSGVASGVYYAVLEVDGQRVGSRKLALVR